MDIEGTYTLQAAVDEVYQCLKDVQLVRQMLPGLERLERAGHLTYVFTLRIKQAPLRGVYSGKVMVQDRASVDPFTVYRFSIEEDGQHNPFSGTWNIRLSQQYENTVVEYSGALNPGKMSALLPPVLVKGAVKILIQQFFTNLAEQLRTTPEPLSPVPGFSASQEQATYFDEHDTWTEGPDRENGRRAVNSFEEATNNEGAALPGTLLHRLVRLVGLGHQNPALEAQWVTRLQRFGAFSILLLLVWIGTRLPRRLLPRN